MLLSTSTTSGAGAMLSLVIPLAIFFLLMYFMIMRPQKKEQQRVKSMLAAMEVGDTVVTTSGFYGVLINITEEDVIVEFGNNRNCRIPMRKSAIAFYAHKRMRQLFFLIRITGGTKIMAFISLFEVIGPNMVGPSSSHTAGAASMALLARKLFPGEI